MKIQAHNSPLHTKVDENNKEKLDYRYQNLQKEVIISPKKQIEISLSSMSLTGAITSIKNNNYVDFESSLERDYIYLLEFDLSVMKYYEQPFKISYFNKNKSSYYVPDFFVENWDGSKYLVEIKYKSDLELNKLKLETKFKWAHEFCLANGFNFKILTEDDIRTYHLDNVRFLLGYKRRKFGFKSTDTIIIYQTLNNFGQLTVQETIDYSVKDEMRKAELIYLIWYMVANYELSYDNSSKLSMDTKIWLP